MATQKKNILIVTDLTAANLFGDFRTSTPDQYLEGKRDSLTPGLTVLNLCRSYQYLSKGYYVSLLADARGQRVLPSLDTIEETGNPFAYFRALREAGLETIDFKLVGGRRLLPKVIVPASGALEILESAGEQERKRAITRYRQSDRPYTEVTSILGHTTDRRFRRHCRAIFQVYELPLVRVRMYRELDGWKVGQILPVSLGQLDEEGRSTLAAQLGKTSFGAVKPPSRGSKAQRIACLWDEDDEFRPSCPDTITKLERAALRQGALFEVISKDDLDRLPEYDALFIRALTGIENHTFVFSQRAQSLGMPVIDDPQSIMKCSNKVYLHELFQREDIPTPRTSIVSRRTPVEEIAGFGFPLIVKLPQGSFSVAVKKADNREALEKILGEMFKQSPLLIVQEFTPTPFDWRIAVLDGKILFTCKYHQARDHWQIARHFESGFSRHGKVEAVPLRSTPAAVRKLALKGAALIGDGFYGVDIKETAAGPLMIEINDNPNLETNFEDQIEKDKIYDTVISVFLRCLREAARTPKAQEKAAP